jgi:hypothetical protein
MTHKLVRPMSQKLCYSRMDRGWMYLATMSVTFVEGIYSFVKVGMVYMANNVQGQGYVHCTYGDCKNKNQFKNIK